VLLDKSRNAAQQTSTVGWFDRTPRGIGGASGCDRAVRFLDSRALELGDGLLGRRVENL
jgi:hypothetical protein